MISYAEALAILSREIKPMAARDGAAPDWAGGVAASAVSSRLHVPPFANAAMDGYALSAADTASASAEQPIELPVWGTVAAGDTPLDDARREGAVEIMTGAALPAGCDAVVPLERVTVHQSHGATGIRITEPVEAGRNVRQPGEDFTAGQAVLEPGTLIEPQHVMALAATGVESVPLRPAPRVVVITTGTEIVTDARGDSPGKIRDANGPYLRAALTRIGMNLIGHRQTTDRAEDIERAITECAEQAEIIVTTGGVSAGRYDLIPEVVGACGGDVFFHKIRIRPGKPVLAARLANGALLAALPGNPIAAAVCFRFIAVPMLRCLRGQGPESFHTAVAATPITKRSEFCFFAKARARIDNAGRLEAELLPGQQSFKIAPLANANCWAIVDEGTHEINAGDLIKVAALYPDGFLQ